MGVPEEVQSEFSDTVEISTCQYLRSPTRLKRNVVPVQFLRLIPASRRVGRLPVVGFVARQFSVWSPAGREGGGARQGGPVLYLTQVWLVPPRISSMHDTAKDVRGATPLVPVSVSYATPWVRSAHSTLIPVSVTTRHLGLSVLWGAAHRGRYLPLARVRYADAQLDLVPFGGRSPTPAATDWVWPSGIKRHKRH